MKEPISKLRLFMRGLGWLAVIPMIAGGVIGAIALSEGRKEARLRDDGAVAIAEITAKNIEVSTDSEGSRTTTHLLTYRFTHDAGTVTVEDPVGSAFYNQLAIGDRTEVRYWRGDPLVNEIEPGSAQKTTMIAGIISAVLLAASGLAVIFLWARAGRILHVRDRGVRRTAVVESHLQTNIKVNNRPRYRLIWRDDAGDEGKSFLMKGKQLGDYPIGAKIVVYCNPQGRQAAVWEGDVGPARRISAVRR